MRCVPAGPESAAVRLLVVPALGEQSHAEDHSARFAALLPRPETLERIRAELEARRCIGAQVLVEPPFYQGVTVVAQLRGAARTTSTALRERALTALYRYLNPLDGGPDGNGWPFGRHIQSGEVYAVLQQVAGVELVEDVRLFGADPRTGERGEPVQRLELAANALAFSYGHQVRVTGPGGRS